MRHMPRTIIPLILAIGLAGCGAAATPAVPATPPDAATTPSPTPTADIPAQPTASGAKERLSSIWVGCSSLLYAVPVHFTGAKGESVEGALMGDGETGIVLSNQSDDDPCAWITFEQALLDAKYRVLSYKYGNGSGADEANAGAAFLAQNGAKRVILVGASRGGAFTATAASRNMPQVVAAVTLSAAILLPGEDPQPVAAQIAMPIMLVTSDVDPSGPYQMAQGIDKLLTVKDKQLLIVPGGPHGIALMDDPLTRGKVMAFLEAHR